MRKRTGRAAPGSGSVYWSSKDKRFVGEIYLGTDDRGVKVKKRLIGPRNERSDDARVGVRDRLKQFQRSHPTPPRGQRRTVSRITVTEYLTSWLAARDPNNRLQPNGAITQRKRLSVAAHEAYRWAFEDKVIPKLGATRLQDLTRTALRQFIDSLTRPNGEVYVPLSDASKAKICTALQGAFQDAVDNEDGPLILINPAARLRFERFRPTKKTKAWDKKQALQFLRTIKGTDYLPMLLVMTVCGLGPAETFGLKWETVDLVSGEIEIVGNLTEVGGKAIPKQTKTEERARTVVLPSIVLRALKARYRKVKPTDYVFTAPEGGHMRLSNFRSRVWPKLLKKAGVPPITIYGLRHSAASILEALGVPLIYVSRILGHANIRTTDRYSHMFKDTQREVASKLNEYLKDL